MKNTDTITCYVDAALALHGWTLTPDARDRVIATFARTATVVGPLLAFELPAEIEPAHIFKA